MTKTQLLLTSSVCLFDFLRVLMGVPSSQLTTNFSAKNQLTTIFLANSQLTANFG